MLRRRRHPPVLAVYLRHYKQRLVAPCPQPSSSRHQPPEPWDVFA